MEDSKDWVAAIPIFIEAYNSTQNDVTKKTPNELNEEVDKKSLKETKQKIVSAVSSKNENLNQKFSEGDQVRRKLDDDEKTDGQNWSKDVFTVYRVEKPKKKNLSSFVYYIMDEDEKYKKKYYSNDLLKVRDVQNKIERTEKYKVSKLIRPVFKNKKPAYVVRWKYYGEKDDTIEPRDQLLEDVPKVVKKFEKDHEIVWYDTRVDWKE